jgi:hypothetical protein
MADLAGSLIQMVTRSSCGSLKGGKFNFFSGFWQWGLPGAIWLMALSGVIVKLFVIHAPRWVTAGIYLSMGWLSVLALPQMLASMPCGALADDINGKSGRSLAGGDRKMKGLFIASWARNRPLKGSGQGILVS